jgi:hypothetical protein
MRRTFGVIFSAADVDYDEERIIERAIECAQQKADEAAKGK